VPGFENETVKGAPTLKGAPLVTNKKLINTIFETGASVSYTFHDIVKKMQKNI